MEQEVKELLEATFPGIVLETEILSDERISGTAIWTGFEGFDHVERQTMIRNVLREKLGTDAKVVGVLLTYTPDEIDAMNAA